MLVFALVVVVNVVVVGFVFDVGAGGVVSMLVVGGSVVVMVEVFTVVVFVVVGGGLFVVVGVVCLVVAVLLIASLFVAVASLSRCASINFQYATFSLWVSFFGLSKPLRFFFFFGFTFIFSLG